MFGRAQIVIFKKMHIKNLMGVSEGWFKKLAFFTSETSNNRLIRYFSRNGRLRVKQSLISRNLHYVA